MRKLAIVITGAFVVSACTALVSTAGLSEGPIVSSEAGATDGADADGAAAADAAAPTAASCRALHAEDVAAPSGVYTLRGADGGAFTAYCDMETADGGWTLVTPAMVVEDKRVQDVVPGSAATVDVKRGTDSRGGLTLDVGVLTPNCGADHSQPSDFYYFLVGELDGWTQIRATYTFFVGATCWNLFGHPDLPNTNVFELDLNRDLFDLDENMARAEDGTVLKYTGQTFHCSNDHANFWHSDYASSKRTARVALRRASMVKPAGLAVSTDCSSDSAWSSKDIFVR
ncbi:MAG: hypothetical protein JWO86_3396 [Myxococcaceae bacterium]|nr:hypothetical protein [Myxococcaceae bacterium]